MLLGHDTVPLRLQPTEVESAHWVPLRHLQNPDLRTFQRCDISERLNRIGGGVSRQVLRLMVGQMLFTGLRLAPSESLYSVQTSRVSNLDFWSPFATEPRTNLVRENPLVLWGLTLGITADFIELIAPLGLSELWDTPTLSAWDVRFCFWVLARWKDAKATSKESSNSRRGPEKGTGRTGGSDNTTFATSFPEFKERTAPSVRAAEFGNHYQLFWQGITVAMLIRGALLAVLVGLLLRKV